MHITTLWGSGHVYQGRFKSFQVQEDEHFDRVVRYVERNALLANLVQRAEDWRWSSLWRRQRPGAKPLMTAPPVPTDAILVTLSRSISEVVAPPMSKLSVGATYPTAVAPPSTRAFPASVDTVTAPTPVEPRSRSPVPPIPPDKVTAVAEGARIRS